MFLTATIKLPIPVLPIGLITMITPYRGCEVYVFVVCLDVTYHCDVNTHTVQPL